MKSRNSNSKYHRSISFKCNFYAKVRLAEIALIFLTIGNHECMRLCRRYSENIPRICTCSDYPGAFGFKIRFEIEDRNKSRVFLLGPVNGAN